MGFTGLNSKCQQSCILSGGSKEEPVSLPSLASRGCLHSLAFPPSSKPVMDGRVFLTLHHPDTESPASLFHLRGPSWLHWVHPDNLHISKSLITSADYILPWELIFTLSGIWDMDIFEGHYSSHHGHCKQNEIVREGLGRQWYRSGRWIILSLVLG